MLEKQLLDIRSAIDSAKKEISKEIDEATQRLQAVAVEEGLQMKNEIESKKAELAELEKQFNELQGSAEKSKDADESKGEAEEVRAVKADEEDDKKEEEEESSETEVLADDTDDTKSEDTSDEEDEDKKKKEERKLNLNEKEDKKMTKELINLQGEQNKDTELRSAIAEFVKGKGRNLNDLEQRGFTSTDGALLIPEEIIYNPKETPETVTDLRQYANEVSVSVQAGSYPVQNIEEEVLVTAQELAENPDLANPTFKEVDFKVETYRGQLKLSVESIEDSVVNLSNLVLKAVKRKALNTTNKKIAEVMKSFTPKAAASLDDIKKIINVEIDPAYNTKLYVSQSFFNAVDTMKAADGRYLLQQDITSPSGYKLFGREVVVLKDTMIGTAVGDKVAFVGDAYAAVTFFNRKEITAGWDENTTYSQVLGIVLRGDFKKVDEAAGFYVTLA